MSYFHCLSTGVKWLASEHAVRVHVLLIHNNEQEVPGTVTKSYTESVSSPVVGMLWVDGICVLHP